MGSLNLGIDFDAQEAHRRVEKMLCERSLAYFIRASWHVVEPGADYYHNWHIDLICAHLEAIGRGEEVDGDKYNRLLINIPPGMMKSLMVGVFWPAWMWGPFGKPSTRFLCASHSQALAIRDNLRMRRLIMSEWYQERWGERVRLTDDQSAKTKFENTATGFREAVAAGSITGSRGDVVICLPYESEVLTSDGWKQIGDIVEHRIDTFIAGSGGWQRIEKYERNRSRPIVRLDFGCTILECTEDHRVFVEGRGWIASSSVNEGDVALVVPHEQLRQLRDCLDRSQKADEVLQPQVLSSVSIQECGAGKLSSLRDVWDTGLQSAGTSWARRADLLLGGMSGALKRWGIEPSVARGKRISRLPSMRRRIPPQGVGGQASQMVFPDVCAPIALGRDWAAGDAFLQAVRGIISAIELCCTDVLQKVRRCGAFGANAWSGKWSIRSWRSGAPISARMVEEVQSGHSRAGWRRLLGLWLCRLDWFSCSPRSSYQLRQERLEAGEPDNGLPVLSWANARKSGEPGGLVRAVVRSVERLERKVPCTYNLRVGPFHDYFANGVLVHNCDDPHSVESASSEQQRETTKEWFLEAVPTRLNKPKESAIVVIMQRLHEEDVSGIILDHKGKGLPGWDHIMLPMRFDPARACTTKLGYSDPRSDDGELLFDARFPGDTVDALEETLGNFATAGQHQQSPIPRGGGIIQDKWWRLWDSETYENLEFIVAAVDTAYGEKQENDRSAIVVFGLFSIDSKTAFQYSTRTIDRFGNSIQSARVYAEGAPNIVMMYAWAGRVTFPDLCAKIVSVCRANKVDRLLIEGKAAGKSVVQELRKTVGVDNYGIQEVDPGKTDKWQRLYSVQHLFAEGIVWAPDKQWSEEVIREVSSFPKGKHDDLVDCVAYALRWLRDSGMLTRAPERMREIEDSKIFVSRSNTAPLYPA